MSDMLPPLPEGISYSRVTIWIRRDDWRPRPSAWSGPPRGSGRQGVELTRQSDGTWSATEYGDTPTDPWGVPIWTATADTLDEIVTLSTRWLEQAS